MQFVSALFAVIFVHRAYLALKLKESPEKEGWKFFTIATYFWLLGATYFGINEVIFKLHTYPSFADIFYFAFYPTIIIGFLKFPKIQENYLNKIDIYIDLTTLIISSSLVIWILGFQDLIYKIINNPSIASYFSFFYVVLDTSILYISFIFLIKRFQFKSYSFPIFYFIVGCYFLIFADLVQAFITTFTTFVSGGVADIGWVGFCLFLGLSGFLTEKNLENLKSENLKSEIKNEQKSISVILLTYIWLLIALSTLIWTVLINRPFNLYIIIPATLIVIFLVLYRQIKIIKEKNELTYTLILTQEDLEKSNEELKALNQDLASESMKLVKLNDKLYQSEEMLIEANESKNKFFSIIAHDLRNPVAAFSQLTELLNLHFTKMTQEEAIEIIDALNKSARFTIELLTNLLDWSQTQTGSIDFNPNSSNIYDIIDKVQRVLGLQARNKNIEIINNIPSVLVLSIDKDMITTVFRNLISNAIKFTPNDGKIFLNATHNHQIVEIVIKDTGIGMSNESISKLFQIKHKQNQLGTNNEKGTGLGLIICKEFIEKHNGEIEVESTLGEGTSFTIKLPK